MTPDDWRLLDERLYAGELFTVAIMFVGCGVVVSSIVGGWPGLAGGAAGLLLALYWGVKAGRARAAWTAAVKASATAKGAVS